MCGSSAKESIFASFCLPDRRRLPFGFGVGDVSLRAFHRLAKIVIVANVVPLEHARGSVARNFHGHMLVRATTDHVTHGTTPEIVEKLSPIPGFHLALWAAASGSRLFALRADERADTGSRAGRPPGLLEIFDRLAVNVEDVGAEAG